MTDTHSKLIETVEGIGTAFEGFQESHAKRMGDFDDRLAAIESKSDRPRGASGNFHRDDLEHKARFESWLRDPLAHATRSQLAEAESELTGERKAVTIGSSAGGGYAVPSIIADEIEARVRVQNPWRALVKTVIVGSSSYSHLVSKNAAGYGWVGEGDTRSETDTSELIQCLPSFGTIYARPKCSEEALADLFFNVGAWLVDEAADGFSAGEAAAIWSGNGTSKPSGLINTTPSSSGDTASPERAATALQYLPIPTAASSPFSTAGITVDSLIDTAYALHERYLEPADGVAWVMRRATAAHVRKLKDDNGQYLWQPSTMAGQPPTLLGYPVAETDSVDAHGVANAFPVAFGNWKRAYLFAIRQDLRITVDDNISTPGQVLFYVRRRVGGKVLNNQAAKLLKFALS
jgi:HK97 family phage major capsid protein